MSQWFYFADGTPYGPVSSAKLRQLAEAGRITPTDGVRREDMSEWHPANRIKGLFQSANDQTRPLDADAQQVEPLAQVTTTSISMDRRSDAVQRRFRLTVISLCSACLIILILILVQMLQEKPEASGAKAVHNTRGSLTSARSKTETNEEKLQRWLAERRNKRANTRVTSSETQLPKDLADETIRKWALKYGWLDALNPRDFTDESARRRHFDALVSSAKRDLEQIQSGSSYLTWEEYFEQMRDFLREDTRQKERNRRIEGQRFFQQLDRMQRSQSSGIW